MHSNAHPEEANEDAAKKKKKKKRAYIYLDAANSSWVWRLRKFRIRGISFAKTTVTPPRLPLGLEPLALLPADPKGEALPERVLLRLRRVLQLLLLLSIRRL